MESLAAVAVALASGGLAPFEVGLPIEELDARKAERRPRDKEEPRLCASTALPR